MNHHEAGFMTSRGTDAGPASSQASKDKTRNAGMKRVAILMPTLSGGGAERVMILVGNHLIRRGYAVDMIVFKDVVTYRGAFEGRLVVILGSGARVSRNPFSFVRGLLRGMRGADVVIGGIQLGPSFAAVAFGKLLGRKTIVMNHSNLSASIAASVHGRLRRAALKALTSALYRLSDRVVCVSAGSRRDMIEGFKVPERLVEAVLNPVDVAHVRRLSAEAVSTEYERIFERPVVAFAGRMHRSKGIDVLLGAFREVQKGFDANLILMGEGADDEYRGLVPELVGRNVFFLGFQQNPFSLIRRSRCFVLPSRYEGFGLVLVEAMACGTPVISSDCPSGPSEILDGGRCGVLVKPGDASALADAMRRLLTDDAYHAELSIAGMAKAAEFDVSRVVDSYVRILEC
jgi:glycosyltransferase involved in cell wall biosynthesis